MPKSFSPRNAGLSQYLATDNSCANNNIIISVDMETAFDKIQDPL